MICEIQNLVAKRTCLLLDEDYVPTTETDIQEFLIVLGMAMVVGVLSIVPEFVCSCIWKAAPKRKFYCKKKRDAAVRENE